MRSLGRALILYDYVLIRRGGEDTVTQQGDHGKTQGEDHIYMLRRAVAEDTNPAGTLN